jgi:hypothetical protein
MSAIEYCFVKDGVVASLVTIDADGDDPNSFALAAGGVLIERASQLGGEWGVGDSYSDGTATVLEKPDVPPTLEERLANIESTTDWLVAVITDPSTTEGT